MNKYYSSLFSSLFSSGCSFIINDVASQFLLKEKKVNRILVRAFLLFMAMSSGQKAMAHNTSNVVFTSQTIFVNYILLSSIAEGRGGGGGHGNSDWVALHQLDQIDLGAASRISNTNQYTIIYKT